MWFFNKSFDIIIALGIVRSNTPVMNPALPCPTLHPTTILITTINTAVRTVIVSTGRLWHCVIVLLQAKWIGLWMRCSLSWHSSALNSTYVWSIFSPPKVMVQQSNCDITHIGMVLLIMHGGLKGLNNGTNMNDKDWNRCRNYSGYAKETQ